MSIKALGLTWLLFMSSLIRASYTEAIDSFTRYVYSLNGAQISPFPLWSASLKMTICCARSITVAHMLRGTGKEDGEHELWNRRDPSARRENFENWQRAPGSPVWPTWQVAQSTLGLPDKVVVG